VVLCHSITRMASSPDEPSVLADDLIDDFLASRGHDVPAAWGRSYNKKQCPECGGLHDLGASSCTVCGWLPAD